MFEMAGPSEEIVKEAMRLAQHNLPIRTKFVALRDFEKGAPLQSGQEHQLQQAAIWKERIEKRVRVIKVKTAKSEEEDAAAAAAPAMTEPALVGGETNE
jgi:ribosomal protein L16/L10AE